MYIYFVLFILLVVNCTIVDSQVIDNDTCQYVKQVQKIIKKDEANTKVWYYSWMSAYLAAAITEGTIGYLSNDKSERQDMFLDAATSSLGFIGVLISPMKPGTISKELNNIENSSQSVLETTAFREREAISWKIHAVSGLVNVGSGLVTWLVFKRSFEESVTDFALNTAVAELQILTTPTKSLKLFNKFSSKNAILRRSYERFPEITWRISITPNMVKLSFTF